MRSRIHTHFDLDNGVGGEVRYLALDSLPASTLKCSYADD